MGCRSAMNASRLQGWTMLSSERSTSSTAHPRGGLPSCNTAISCSGMKCPPSSSSSARGSATRDPSVAPLSSRWCPRSRARSTPAVAREGCMRGRTSTKGSYFWTMLATLVSSWGRSPTQTDRAICSTSSRTKRMHATLTSTPRARVTKHVSSTTSTEPACRRTRSSGRTMMSGRVRSGWRSKPSSRSLLGRKSWWTTAGGTLSEIRARTRTCMSPMRNLHPRRNGRRSEGGKEETAEKVRGATKNGSKREGGNEERQKK
mmetsp:Transcript_68062/g.151952  ORF Transcript_68062/g.151952 Transcript_68062/m.151952 type:complete len:260 (+) Transcript_68062:96-875(+)